MFRKKIFFYFILFLFSRQIKGQQLTYNTYTVKDGLSFVQVSKLFQDSKGYIWCSGIAGIDKFNGKTFQNYSPAQDLADYNVTCIGEAFKKNWVGTINGLNIICANNKIVSLSIANGLPTNNILFIKPILNTNDVLVSTTGGLCIIDSLYKIKKIKSNTANLVCNDATDFNKDTLILATNKGIAYFVNTKIIFLKIGNSNLQEEFFCLKKIKSNTFLLSNKVKFFLFENGYLKEYTPKGFTIDLNVNSQFSINDLFIENENEWYAGTSAGLLKITPQKSSFEYIGNDLNSNNIYAIIKDFEGNKWVATYSGICCIKPNNFINYNTENGVKVPFIYGACEDFNNNIWFCSFGGGLYKYNNAGVFENYTINNGLGSNFANTIIQYKKDRLLVGTSKGLTLIDLKKNEIKKLLHCDGLEDKNIQTLHYSKDSTLYIGTGNKLYIGKGHSFKEIKTNLPSNATVYSIYKDAKNRIWVGTFLSGLYELVNEKLIDRTALFNNKLNSICSIKSDDNGNVYFASFDGVYVLKNDGKIDNISTKEGLGSNLVYELYFDKETQLMFIGSNQGLSKLNVKRYLIDGKKEVEHYGLFEGFSGVECNAGGMVSDSKDNIWVGTVNGIMKFHKSSLKPSNIPAKLTIKKLTINDVDTFANSPLRLNYSSNNISFFVEGISMSNPLKIKYKFYLEGFDKKWSELTSQDIFKYSNLPSGRYTFHVVCINNSGKWSSEKTLSFEIKPPWYKSTLALSIYFLISTLLIYLFVMWRIKITRNKEARKTLLASYELKALRAQMNPHFIFNALNSIQHYMLSNDATTANKYLSKFAKLVRKILGNSERAQIVLSEEIEYIKLYLDLESMRFENVFIYDIQIDDNVLIDQIEIPTMLIQPYVENAILHGLVPKRNNGYLELYFTLYNQKTLKCTISDNGIGRDAAAQLKRSSINKHQSSGTRITQNRLELLNKMNNSNLSVNISDLDQSNDLASGTKVSIFIPFDIYN